MIEVKNHLKKTKCDRTPFFSSRLALDLDEQTELTFPADDLTKLEEQINRLRWTVPVLAHGELIKCLRAAVRFANASQ